MKKFYRVLPGRKCVYAEECLIGGFIGAQSSFDQDLTGRLPGDWRTFNAECIPIMLGKKPGLSKVSAGLSCGFLWTIAKGIQEGDIILCPDGTGIYHAGEVVNGYYYVPGEVLPHRRRVKWLNITISRSVMSDTLQKSANSPGTVADITSHHEELERIISSGVTSEALITEDPAVEDPVAFVMEKHLEIFLIAHWNQTELSKDYSIYEEDGELVGQHYPTDTGPIDILAVSKDRRRLLVVELKRGRASDIVVGQTLRYMGYIQEQIAEPDQSVEGAIIALEDDKRLRQALAAVPSISFYRYRLSFDLEKG